MRIRIFCAVFVVIGFLRATAQDSATQSSQSQTRFGVSAGPAFIDFIGEAYFPGLSYQAGIFGITRFKKIGLQYGVQYFPAGALYKDASGTYSRFVNHVASFSTQSKFYFGRVPRLSFDVGASFGWAFSYHDSFDPPNSGIVCDCIGGVGQQIGWQMFLLTGFSWELPKGNGLGLTSVVALPIQQAVYGPTELILLQGSFSHTF